MSLGDTVAKKGDLPTGAIRLAVSVDDTESQDDIKRIKDLDPAMVS